jgi:hypothetical protein
MLLKKIHMDSTDPSTALTALYSNVAPPTVRPPSSTLSHPLSSGNNGNSGDQNKNNNKNRNDGHSGGNNGRNNNGSGGRNSSSGQTTIRTASDGQTGTPWLTCGHPWQGHMIIYPGSVHIGQQRSQAFMATPGPYLSPGFLPASSSSSRRSTSRPLPLFNQAGTPGSAQVGTSNRWPTPSTLCRSTHLRLWYRTGWPTPA